MVESGVFAIAHNALGSGMVAQMDLLLNRDQILDCIRHHHQRGY